jgi:hypothetical protein
MFKPGSESDRAIEALARSIARECEGRIELGVLSEVIAELFERWVLEDANHKAPEQWTPEMRAWLIRLAAALERARSTA